MLTHRLENHPDLRGAPPRFELGWTHAWRVIGPAGMIRKGERWVRSLESGWVGRENTYPIPGPHCQQAEVQD